MCVCNMQSRPCKVGGQSPTVLGKGPKGHCVSRVEVMPESDIRILNYLHNDHKIHNIHHMHKYMYLYVYSALMLIM